MNVSHTVNSLSKPDPQYNEDNSVKTRTWCIIIYQCTYIYIPWHNSHLYYLIEQTFFSMSLSDASEHIGWISAKRILFHIIGPWYLIPVFVKFDTRKGYVQMLSTPGIVLVNCVIIWEEIVKYCRYMFTKNFEHKFPHKVNINLLYV